MRRYALPLVVLFALSTALVSQAQETTPTPFQDVQVGEWTFHVSNYYPCVTFLTSRVTKLAEGGGVITTLTWQPFFKSGNQMVSVDAFTSFDNDLTLDVPVGSALICVPQVIAEEAPATGTLTPRTFPAAVPTEGPVAPVATATETTP